MDEPLHPQISSTSRGQGVEGRWRWWYADIADYMIRNPGCKVGDCAAALNRGANTVSMIINTDMFKEYYRRRRDQWVEEHDHMLRAKLTDVAAKGLDVILEEFKTKGNKIPMQRVEAVTLGALDKLGYGKAPTVNIDARQDNRQQAVVLQGVTTTELEEARMSLRAAEATKRGQSVLPPANHSVDSYGGMSTRGAVGEEEAGIEVSDLDNLLDEVEHAAKSHEV